MSLNFLMLGAQKSASTFIQHCLMTHPDVWMPREEISAFESPDYENGAVNALFRRFGGRSEKIRGIKRPNYLCLPGIAERIKENTKTPKFLVVLRNPIDRTRSAYFHYAYGGFAPIIELNAGIEGILDGKLKSGWPRVEEIINFSMYGKGIERFLAVFPPSSFMFITHDEVSQCPQNSLTRVCDFLDIDKCVNFGGLNRHPQSVIYSPQMLRVAQFRNRIVYSYNNNRLRVEYRNPRFFWRSLSRLLKELEHLVLDRFYPARKKPNFNQLLESRLSELFAADIEKTERLTGLDLSAWKSS
ncbi:MAG: sulfotransferase [Synoicihabitans sp.]